MLINCMRNLVNRFVCYASFSITLCFFRPLWVLSSPCYNPWLSDNVLICNISSNLLLEFSVSQGDLWTTQHVAPPDAAFSYNIGWKALIISTSTLLMLRYYFVPTIQRMGLGDALYAPNLDFKFPNMLSLHFYTYRKLTPIRQRLPGYPLTMPPNSPDNLGSVTTAQTNTARAARPQEAINAERRLM
jgi:hypothetical protein